MEPWILRLLLVITVVTNVVYSCYQSSWCVEEDWLAPPGTLGGDSDCVKKSRVKSGQGFCVVQRDATNGHPVRYRAISPGSDVSPHDICFEYGISPVEKDEFLVCVGEECNRADNIAGEPFLKCAQIENMFGKDEDQNQGSGTNDAPIEAANHGIPIVVVVTDENDTEVETEDSFQVSSSNPKCPSDFKGVEETVLQATLGKLDYICPSANAAIINLLADYCEGRTYSGWVSPLTKVDGILDFCGITLRSRGVPEEDNEDDKEEEKQMGFWTKIWHSIFG